MLFKPAFPRCLLYVVFALAKIERKNERLRGKMPEDEKAALKEELKRLKERLEAEKAVKRNVDSLLYKLEVSLSRCRLYTYRHIYRYCTI
jgi:uncharacterized alpha-E superfamily protein